MTTSESFLGRLGRNWADFWFKPGNAHTLSLMRCLTGIFVIYLHLAYTRDLQNFFGKHAWIDLKLANDVRNDYPFPPPQLDWKEPEAVMIVPQDREVRATFFDWLRSLPADRAQRRVMLEYLYEWMPAEPTQAQDGLLFIRRLRIRPKEDLSRPRFDQFEFVAPEERQRHLNAVTNPPANEEERDKLVPRYMLDEQVIKKEKRQQIRDSAERLANCLPNDPKRIAQIIFHMAYQSSVPVLQRSSYRDPRNELERTLKFIDEDFPAEAVERDRVLKYFDRWGLDERKLLTKGQNSFSIWFHVTDPTAMYVIHFAFLGAMVMFTLGLFTRVTSILTWLSVLCYVHRTPQVLFGMDVMMNICLIYLMLAPCGTVYSLDRWLAKRKARRQLEEARRTGKDTAPFEAILAEPPPSVSANFVTRLYQVHFCFIYMAAGLSKLKGPAWWNHTALWGTIANPEFSPTIFQPYRWALTELSNVRWLWELGMTGGVVFTMILEIGLPFLIWRPRLRPYLVIAGVLFHAGIATFMGLTVFGLFMMVLLMSYIPPEVVRRWIDGGMSLFGRLTPAQSAMPPPRTALPEAQKLKA